MLSKRGLVVQSCDQQKVAPESVVGGGQESARLLHWILVVGVCTPDMHVTRIRTRPALSSASR